MDQDSLFLSSSIFLLTFLASLGLFEAMYKFLRFSRVRVRSDK